MKTITLPCYGIVVTLNDGGGAIASGIQERCPTCHQYFCVGHLSGDFRGEKPPFTPIEHEDDRIDRERFNTVIDGVEQFILSAACAGIDIETPAFLEAIETTVNAVANNT